MRWTLVLLTGLLASCVHAPPSPLDAELGPINRSEYTSLIATNTSKVNRYSGFYQTFQADMTILTTAVQTAELKQKAHFLLWDIKAYRTEREKMLQEASAYSKFFMRFYSPEDDYDDFSKGQSIWNIYLELDGRRIEGKVKKLKSKYVELQTLYPHFDRFSTPYEITFNVPMTTLETRACKVILTSSLGSAEFQFPQSK